MDNKKYNLIKEKYGLLSSWAVWAEASDKPKSNMGDLSIFNDPQTIEYLNENIIFVGLNISRGSIKEPFANFHDANPRATDFKTRYALKNTPYWGGYMTDIIKNYSEVDSGQIPKYLKDNPDIEANNIKVFEEELDDLGSENPLIIAFGTLTFKILLRNFKRRYKIKKIPHYASHGSKEKYREVVKEILNS
ncbi:hypothetical protein N9512_01965 [Amylibacter sp.]|nr:hypothetical protein [Amylibacter sp.]